MDQPAEPTLGGGTAGARPPGRDAERACDLGLAVRARGDRAEYADDELGLGGCGAPVTEYVLKPRPAQRPGCDPVVRCRFGRVGRSWKLRRSVAARAGALRPVYRLSVVLVAMVMLGAGGIVPAAAEAATRVFEGAWFQVAYPADFAVVPSLPSTTADGFDSAFFKSPDGAVEFYVFAPQWGGEPGDIALDPGREEVVGERIVQRGGRTLTWRTIAARDGSYERAYQITRDPAGPSLSVVGIKYRDAAALSAYRAAYASFKESLEMWAD